MHENLLKSFWKTFHWPNGFTLAEDVTHLINGNTRTIIQEN